MPLDKRTLIQFLKKSEHRFQDRRYFAQKSAETKFRAPELEKLYRLMLLLSELNRGELPEYLALPCPPASVTVVVVTGSGIFAHPFTAGFRTHEGLRHGIASSLYEMFWVFSFDTRNASEVSVSGNDAAYFGVFHYSHMGTIVWADTMLVKDVNGIPDV